MGKRQIPEELPVCLKLTMVEALAEKETPSFIYVTPINNPLVTGL